MPALPPLYHRRPSSWLLAISYFPRIKFSIRYHYTAPIALEVGFQLPFFFFCTPTDLLSIRYTEVPFNRVLL
jgi:hypothetical protein